MKVAVTKSKRIARILVFSGIGAGIAFYFIGGLEPTLIGALIGFAMVFIWR